jgi:hypothetical protein
MLQAATHCLLGDPRIDVIPMNRVNAILEILERK